MLLKQISVFAENRRGAVLEITKALSGAGVNIRAISIADTAEFGIVRLIVDKRAEAKAAIKEAGMAVVETDVLALEVDDTPGSLMRALELLCENDVMIEYSYGFVSPIGGGATIILKCDDQERAESCLETNGFKLLAADAVKF